MRYFKKFSYYQKLIVLLLVLALVFTIPYALVLYNSSKNKILESIQYSNDQSLTQIKYNYTTYTDLMTNLCFSISLNNEIQYLLYNQDITHQESNAQITYLKSSVLNIYPSIYSISIYNGSEQKLYSTLTDSSRYFADLNDYMKNSPEIPKLQPILRKVPHMYKDSSLYVFSYVLYDIETSDKQPYSYIILEQNASWLIENFNEISHLNENLPNRIYLLDQNGNICSEDTENVSETDRRILAEHFANQGNTLRENSSYYYIHPFEDEKYLITSLQLNKNGDSLVMLQNYKDVFSSLESFRFMFQIILIIWIILLILSIFGISRSLYMPIRNTLSYISELSGNSIHEGNEFQQLQILYKDSYDKITKQDDVTQHTLKQYQLEKILTDSSPSALKNFAAFAPNHWLASPIEDHLRIFLLTVNRGAGAKNALSEEDFNLFLFIIQNILTELLTEEGQSEVFIAGNSCIWGILQTYNTYYDLILEEVISKAKCTLQKYINLPLDVTYSRPIKDPAQLNTLYYEILSFHDYHYICGPDAIIDPLTCKKNLAGNSNRIPKSLEKKCLTALKCDHVDDAVEALHLIFDAFHEMKYEHVQICVMTLTNQINFTLKEMCISRNMTSAIHFEQIYHQLDNTQYLEEIELILTQYLSDSMNVFLIKTEDTKQQLFVEKIKKYIELNYSDPNLSSQMLATYMNLSAKYVLKKFQDCSGVSLNDYITDIRMRRAADILRVSDESINKVAEQVGILNENYFYKLFKKTYGCTPREFCSCYLKDIGEKS